MSSVSPWPSPYRSRALLSSQSLDSPLPQSLYPDMYRVDALETVATREDEEGVLVPDPPRLQLSAEKVIVAWFGH